jgi:hypothetical protein
VPDSPDIPYLDYTSLRFPSDTLTLRKLREMEPDKFDVDRCPRAESAGPGKRPSFETAVDIMYSERIVALTAFAEVLELPLDIPEYGDCVDGLLELYPSYGLAPGATAALELIKGIQAQVTAQAKAYRKEAEPPSRA